MENKRAGLRKSREKRPSVKRKVGNYLFVTDTIETERNYLTGLINEISSDHNNIKILTARTQQLLETCRKELYENPNYHQAWIVFDCDQVKNFDQIIEEAQNEGIRVAWSNPCIETWFSTYFKKMLTYPESKHCCTRFGELFKKETKRVYKKNDKQIYKLLNKFGDEQEAISRAKIRHKQHQRNGCTRPSQMIPNSTFYQLLEEVRP